ncbi:uncharacterized protein LOC143201830 isoform X2 [Rhynchophorus ferrugineus]|uniref:uncharacterized protein LOC143201830 isoform X2 n=1 Tax=Rhynchophorus ferrugineus TaxID=354439 RepID=UPI003FCEC1EC
MFLSAGELLVRCNSDKNWYHRKVQIRGGLLYVCSAPGENGSATVRLPLRHLSLQAGPLPHSLAICRGLNVVLTLQTADKKSFDQWVKIIAIELIRQTPLDAIKYLDILTLAESWTRDDAACAKDWNFNNIPAKELSPLNCAHTSTPIKTVRIPEWNYEQATKAPEITISTAHCSDDSEEVIENLLKKCQNVETYVPVKEKLFLFESLCKLGRKVRSSEDVSLRLETSVAKRAKSCHDLSNMHTHIAVREICKYFEHRVESDQSKSNIQKSGAILRHLRSQKAVTT